MRARSFILAAVAVGVVLGLATNARADDDDFGHWGLSFSFGPGFAAPPPPPVYYAPPPPRYYYRPPPVYYAPPPPQPYYAPPVYAAPWGHGDDDDGD